MKFISKRFALPIAMALALCAFHAKAADNIAAPIVKGEATVSAPGASPVKLSENQAISPGSEIQTGSSGEVVFDFNIGSRAVVMGNSKVVILNAHGLEEKKISSGWRIGTALKAVFTHNDATAELRQPILPSANLTLGNGKLISLVEQSRQLITLPMGYVYGTSGSFITTVDSPESIRVTVRDGFVTLGLPDGYTVPVKAGEYVRLVKARTRTGFALIGPGKVTGEPLARADLLEFENLRESSKGILEPIAEFIENPNNGSPGNVGSGLSSPFDLRNRLLVPGNPNNTVPPFVCPDR